MRARASVSGQERLTYCLSELERDGMGVVALVTFVATVECRRELKGGLLFFCCRCGRKSYGCRSICHEKQIFMF